MSEDGEDHRTDLEVSARATHKHVEVIDRAWWEGEVVYEVELCSRCGAKNGQLDGLTCDEWFSKALRTSMREFEDAVKDF